jgi:hypothetical protein
MILTANVTDKLINEIFVSEIAKSELYLDSGYTELVIADITKEIIEATLKISMDYIDELNRK